MISCCTRRNWRDRFRCRWAWKYWSRSALPPSRGPSRIYRWIETGSTYRCPRRRAKDIPQSTISAESSRPFRLFLLGCPKSTWVFRQPCGGDEGLVIDVGLFDDASAILSRLSRISNYLIGDRVVLNRCEFTRFFPWVWKTVMWKENRPCCGYSIM